MAALHRTLVTAKGAQPAVLTYSQSLKYYCTDVALGKLRVGLAGPAGIRWLADAPDLALHNTPDGEGIQITGTVDGHQFKVEAMPTKHGRESDAWEGLALIKVACVPPVPLLLRFGAPGRMRIISWANEGLPMRHDYLAQPEYQLLPEASVQCTAQHHGGGLAAKELSVRAWINFTAPAGGLQVRADKEWLEASLEKPAAEAYVSVGFAEQETRARKLAEADPKALEKECRDYFAGLHRSAWIETPVKPLNEAFQAALVNLEYAWVRPYGWIESVHHWQTLYSQQHNMAADLIGQADRSRDMLLSHARRIYPDGQIPQLDAWGRPRKDFGGWNQFYAWGLQHNWRNTADRKFLDKIWEPFMRSVDQTFQRHDPDGNGLLGFGQQIGNQEDYISTPEDGTSPTIAGLEMRKIQAEFTATMGRSAEAAQFSAQAQAMAQTLRKQLWQTDLGRYPFYCDRTGVVHRDGQYHSLIWPVMYGLLSPQDGYMSMRHLQDTLIGPEGQLYVSNNFPNHLWCTVGCQAGGQQQPWATFGWGRLGYAEWGEKPLEWIAELVTRTNCEGSWPEVYEKDPSYFTPPAGVYIWGVTEALFGLSPDKPMKRLQVAPCLPEAWPQARLHLPEYDLTVTQSNGHRRIECHSTLPLRHVYRVPLPPCSYVKVVANGQPVTSVLEPGVGHIFVNLELPESNVSVVELNWSPLPVAISASAEVAPGEAFIVETGALPVQGISDPCGVLADMKPGDGQTMLRLREGVAADADDYGPQGQKILTRRTVFLDIKAGASHFWQPVDFAVRPALRFTAAPHLEHHQGRWSIHFGLAGIKQASDSIFASMGGLSKPAIMVADNASSYTVELTDDEIGRVLPGLNPLTVALKDGRSTCGTFDAAQLIAANDDLRRFHDLRLHPIKLPEESLSPDTDWRNWREYSAFMHPPWTTLDAPLKPLEGMANLTPSACPGLSFANPGRRVLVVSPKLGRSAVTIPTQTKARKVYLLLLPLLDNHDIFAPVGRLTVRCGDGATFSRTLHIPGDVGWWGPSKIVGGFSTVGSGWSKAPEWESSAAVMNIIELDLSGLREVSSVSLETIGTHPALGIVGLTLLGEAEPTKLASFPKTWTILESQTLFDFSKPLLEGWKKTGTAWGISNVATDYFKRHGKSPYFADSRSGGEQATGTLTSLAFVIDRPRVSFLANGHGADDYFALVDADSGRELLHAGAPEVTGAFIKITWDVRSLHGRRIRFKAVDDARGETYSWIGFDKIVLEP